MTVPASSWWAPALNPKGLSQGDLISGLLVGTVYGPADGPPVVFLGRNKTHPKGKGVHWPQRDALDPFSSDSTGLYIARGKIVRALVVSHSCELEKKDNARVLVAMTGLLSTVQDPAKQAAILEQRRRAFMPLPDVPGAGDHYADLRTIAYVERKQIPDSSREQSMTEEAVVRLRAQLIEYFTRMPVDDGMKELIARGLADEEGSRPAGEAGTPDPR